MRQRVEIASGRDLVPDAPGDYSQWTWGDVAAAYWDVDVQPGSQGTGVVYLYTTMWYGADQAVPATAVGLRLHRGEGGADGVPTFAATDGAGLGPGIYASAGGLLLPNGQYGDRPRFLPSVVMQAPTASESTRLHCFFPITGVDAQTGDWVGVALGEMAGTQAQGVIDAAALALPDKGPVAVGGHNFGIVVAQLDGAVVQIRAASWPEPYDCAAYTFVPSALPLDEAFQGAVAIDVRCLEWPDATQADSTIRVILAVTLESPGAPGEPPTRTPVFGEAPLGADGKIDAAQITWTKAPTIGSFGFATLHLGADGQIYAHGSFEPGDAATTPALLRRDAPGVWTSLPSPWASQGFAAPGICYLPGQPLPDARTPLYRVVLGLAGSTSSTLSPAIDYVGSVFGHLRQRPETVSATAPPDAPGSLVLVGIIEGPPPVPNENLNISGNENPSGYFNAITTLDQSSASSSGSTYSLSQGFCLQVSSSVGFIEKIKTELNVNWGQTARQQSNVTVTDTTLYQANAVAVPDPVTPNRYSVQGTGQMIVAGLGWAGVAYEFVAPDGTVPPNAPVYHQLWPTGMTFQMLPYLMNPATGPTPGVLSSYPIPGQPYPGDPSQTWEDFLDAHSQLGPVGIPGSPAGGETMAKRITVSWDVGGSIQQQYQEVRSDEATHGSYFDLQAMVSASFGIPKVASGSIGAGVQAKIDQSWSTGETQSVRLSSTVQLRGNLEVAGTYASYTYYTYLLQPDEQWYDELVASLVTDSWPPVGSTDRDTNLKALAAIRPPPGSKASQRSAPWKICYAMGPSEIISAEQAQAARLAGGTRGESR